jgi:hypothetical protein
MAGERHCSGGRCQTNLVRVPYRVHRGYATRTIVLSTTRTSCCVLSPLCASALRRAGIGSTGLNRRTEQETGLADRSLAELQAGKDLTQATAEAAALLDRGSGGEALIDTG